MKNIRRCALEKIILRARYIPNEIVSSRISFRAAFSSLLRIEIHFDMGLSLSLSHTFFFLRAHDTTSCESERLALYMNGILAYRTHAGIIIYHPRIERRAVREKLLLSIGWHDRDMYSISIGKHRILACDSPAFPELPLPSVLCERLLKINR